MSAPLYVTIHTTTNNIKIDLTNIPVLDIGNRQGSPDYIDFLKWEEVTEPIMKGIDIFNRTFIVVKLIINNNKIMETYFQRYTRETSHWHCCGHATSLLISTTGGMNESQANYIKSLVEKGEVQIEIKHRPENKYKYMIGQIVRIFNEKKWNASIIIQRHFRKCRYDPSYKMCGNIQWKMHQEICDKYYNNKIIK